MKRLLLVLGWLGALAFLPLLDSFNASAGMRAVGGIVQSNVTITGGTINGIDVTTLNAPATEQRTLFILRSADMTLTTDQTFVKQGTFTNYVVTGVIAVRKSGAFGVSCLGGIYTAGSKGGDIILAATQTYATLTGVGTATVAAVANLISKQESATPILSLTTGNTGALTADFFIVGTVVD